ncbi:TPA: ABC transporter permease subunit [Staphylococcus aureus]|nr:ABC transporter permease subunit [Staphylococcus aureus]
MDVLTIEHLTKKIGNKTILEDVSFKLKRGQIVGLVGANGAGKTTLMKVILGYSSFQSGNFNVINSKDSKNNIGALIENPGIYPFMSGYENLKLLNESKNTQGYIATKYNEIFTPQESFTSAYNGFSWFAFLLIIQASTIISMEFHYGTIKNLLYREYSRTTMIVSKIITLFIISLIYFVITIIASIVIGSLFFNDLNIFESSGNQLSLLNQLLLVSLGTFVGVWLVLSLTLLLSSATNSTGVAIAVGIVFYFASSILAVIQTALLEKIDWLKWNPINMMNIMLQTVEKGFSKSTKLELHELFIGNIAYISIFLILVVFIFKKKNI